MELPKVTELKKIIKFCRENGINSLKHGEFEVTLSSASHFPEGPKADASTEEVKSTDPFAGLTPDQILNWSSAPLVSQEEAN